MKFVAAAETLVSRPDAPETRAREHVLENHEDVVVRVLAAADAVADDWSTLADGRRATPERDAVLAPLRTALDRSGVLGRLPEVLTGAVEAAGYRLSATPVAAPPYVAVTSTGPVLRGTVADGRLVLSVDCFEVVRDADLPGADFSRTAGSGRVLYARTTTDPAAALTVRFRRTDS